MKHEKQRSPFLPLFAVLLAMAVLNGALVLVRAEMTSTTAILVLYYACSLLSLFGTMIFLGAALFYLSRQMAGISCRILLLGEVISLIPLLAAAVRTAFDYPDYFTDTLVTEILMALGNTILMMGIHLALLLLSHLLYFRKAPAFGMPRISLRHTRQGLANFTVVSVLFVYQIVAETITTVDFVTTYWPNVYRNEIASIVFSYIYIVISLLLGYFIQYLTQAFLYEAYQES